MCKSSHRFNKGKWHITVVATLSASPIFPLDCCDLPTYNEMGERSLISVVKDTYCQTQYFVQETTLPFSIV